MNTYRSMCGILLLLISFISFAKDYGDDERCVRKYNKEGVHYCSVPYAALLADFRKYDGENVHFYGYLNFYSGSGSDYAMVSSSADGGVRVDFSSCVNLKISDVAPGALPFEGNGIYFVELSGKYEFTPDFPMCVGVLTRANVRIMSVVEVF